MNNLKLVSILPVALLTLSMTASLAHADYDPYLYDYSFDYGQQENIPENNLYDWNSSTLYYPPYETDYNDSTYDYTPVEPPYYDYNSIYPPY